MAKTQLVDVVKEDVSEEIKLGILPDHEENSRYEVLLRRHGDRTKLSSWSLSIDRQYKHRGKWHPDPDSGILIPMHQAEELIKFIRAGMGKLHQQGLPDIDPNPYR